MASRLAKLRSRLTGRETVILIGLTALSLSVGLYRGSLTLLLYLLATSVLGFANFKWALAALLLAMPYAGGSEEYFLSFGPLRFVAPLVAALGVLHYLVGTIKIKKTYYHVLGLSFIFSAGISTLIEGSGTYIPHFFVMCSYVILSFVVLDYMSVSHGSFYFVALSLVMSVVVGFAVSYIEVGGFAGGYKRFGITEGGGIRTLANLAGFLCVFLLVVSIQWTRSWLGKRIRISSGKRRIVFLLAILALGVVALTIVRGVILAVLIAFIALLVLTSIVSFLYRKNHGSRWFGVALAAAIIVPLIWMFDRYVVGGGVMARFAQVERGYDVRTAIWNAGFNSLEGTSMIFGSGISSFRDIVLRSLGRDFYAHSVYLDAIVSTGLLGGSIFFLLVAMIGMRAVKLRDTLSFTMWVFTMVAMATAGGLVSVDVWVFLGFIVGLQQVHQATSRRRQMMTPDAIQKGQTPPSTRIALAG